jgi:drug/metabolite transporter (DMT)-like permease
MQMPPAASKTSDAPSIVAARLMVVVAALLWSTSGFFAKAPYFAAWPGPLLAFWRAAFACFILVPMVRKPAWSWKLILMTATFAAMNFTYLTAMAKGNAANAIWLQNTAPVWVLLAGVLVFGERAHLRDWLLILFCGVGVSLILWYESSAASLAAVGYGLLSGLFYAGIVLSLRNMRGMEAAWLIALNHVITALVLAPYAVVSFRTGEHWPHGSQWWLLAGFGMLQMGLPYVLFARSLKTIPGHEAAGIGLIEPLLVPVWVFVAWRHSPEYQAPQWWTIAGGGLIFLGLFVRYVGLPGRPVDVATEVPLQEETALVAVAQENLPTKDREMG